MSTPALRLVYGHAVIADHPAPSNLTDKSGNPVYFRQIRTLTLDNNEVVYGCAHCDYTAEHVNSVRPHLNKHRDTKAKPTGPASAVTVLAEENARLTAEVERWRNRARNAEKTLAAIRRAWAKVTP